MAAARTLSMRAGVLAHHSREARLAHAPRGLRCGAPD
jgi:hypothetical protein